MGASGLFTKGQTVLWGIVGVVITLTFVVVGWPLINDSIASLTALSITGSGLLSATLIGTVLMAGTAFYVYKQFM